MLALLQIEFLGQSLWWAATVALTGIVLLIYAGMLRKESKKPAPETEMLGRSANLSLRAGPETLTLFGLPVAWLALLMGVASLALTTPILLLQWQSVALAWTAFILLSAVFLFYRRVYAALSRFRMSILFGLRALGIVALLLLLFQPILGFVHTPDSQPRLAIVIDASGSMGYSDAANQPNRYRQSAIAVQTLLVPRLEKLFNIEIFAYDGKHTAPLDSADSLDQISPEGEVTDLGAALGLGTSANASQVILFSDGIHNGPIAVTSEIDAGKISVPIHTVRVGSSEVEPSSIPDIAVISVEGPQTTAVNNAVTLTASIRSTAMSDRAVRVMLKDDTGKILNEQRLVLRSGATPQTVQLKFTPDKVGRLTLRVQVPVDPGERSEANNQQDFAILVTDPKLEVLYVEGRVRPEVGPLKRALEQDPNIQLVSMIQTVAGRFTLSGLKDGDDLHGIPTSLAQWKRFKVIIIGDLDASFMTDQQERDLGQTVGEGAGLLMIGGSNSFAPGGWAKTPLATLLPVSLAPVTPPQINTKFVPQLTAAGLAHPIFKNIASYFISPSGQTDSQQMPDLSGCVALAGAKPAAEILAVHPTEKINGAPAIVLATQQYGKGRTAAFAADTTWHWNLFLRGLGKDSPYNRFWGQMVRWLASEEDLQKKTGPSVVAMLAKERYEAGEEVTLRAAVTDKDGQSTNYANVWAEITGPDGKTARVPMTAKNTQGGAGQIGIYEALEKPVMAGKHAITFHAAKDSLDLGKDDSSFTVLPAASEKDVLAANPATLQEISHATGGSYVELAGVDALADRLEASAPETAAAVKTSFPLYSNRWFFFLFIAAFAGEWFLRRKWQLQ